MAEHRDLTGASLHEPKGADAASSEQILVADGAGATEWKGSFQFGWEDQNHSGSSQNLTSGSFIDLNNNGTGPNTNESYVLPGYSSVWDTSNNEFDWAAAGLEVGDIVDVRFDYSVTTGGNNRVIIAGMDLAHGHVNEYRLIFGRQEFNSSGTYQYIVNGTFYIGNSATLNNPAKVIMSTGSSGNSVLVNGWFIKVWPRRLVFN